MSYMYFLTTRTIMLIKGVSFMNKRVIRSESLPRCKPIQIAKPKRTGFSRKTNFLKATLLSENLDNTKMNY